MGARWSSTTKRVVLPAPNTNLVFENVETASAVSLQGRDVEVKVAACAVAYRDIIDRTGGFPFMNQPTVLGHEFSGIVTKVGGDTKNLSVGDKVISLHWAQMDGKAFPAPFMMKESMPSRATFSLNSFGVTPVLDLKMRLKYAGSLYPKS